MIKANRNQAHNISNSAQGDTKKVLTVCSAGLLRSATLQNMLIREYGYNVRNCGTEDYALIPISEALVTWANEIIFVEDYNYQRVKYDIEDLKHNIIDKCHVLNIPDIYGFNHPKLIESCKEQYKSKVLNNDKQGT